MKKKILIGILSVITLVCLICFTACQHTHSFSETIIPATCKQGGYTLSVCECGENQKHTFTLKLEHVFDKKNTDEEYLYKQVSCETSAEYYYSCQCGAKGEQTFEDGLPTGHSYSLTLDANYFEHWYACANCGDKKERAEHTFTNDVCTCGKENTTLSGQELFVRVDKKGNYDSQGSYLLFGSYPQLQVKDENYISQLNKISGDLPTATHSGLWTDYGYYAEGNTLSYMWYIDIDLQDGSGKTDKYRGVYFSQYRPNSWLGQSSIEQTFQDDNGFENGKIYWFKFQPILWRILNDNDTKDDCDKTGKAFLLCESIIDSQPYYIDYYSRNIGGVEIGPSNYAHSTIRSWLNNQFFNTALTPTEQAIVDNTLVKNNVRSTNPAEYASGINYGMNDNACENTTDKVFLLSMQEVTDGLYGYDTHYDLADKAREKQSTDYAKIQGLCVYGENSSWWLRSPEYKSDCLVYGVDQTGLAYFSDQAYATREGIVPALYISLGN